MKCVVTYFQNKRIAMPSLFAKYSLPMMREKFPGEVSCYLIHHDHHIEHSRLASNRTGEDGLLRVREYIKEGRFEDYSIISHQEVFPDLFLLPSCRMGMEQALNDGADYHLWLEDDAVVYDKFCGLWPTLMRGCEVGLFRQTNHIKMFNCAFMLTTPEYDSRLLKAINDFKDVHIEDHKVSSPFENLLWKTAKSSCILHPNAAIRHHPRGDFRTTAKQLATWFRKEIPNVKQEDLELLRYDFNDYENESIESN